MKFRVIGANTESNPTVTLPMIVSLKRDHYVQDVAYWWEVSVFADANSDGVADASKEIPDPIFEKKYEITTSDATKWATLVARRKGDGNLENKIRNWTQNRILEVFPSATFVDLDTDA